MQIESYTAPYHIRNRDNTGTGHLAQQGKKEGQQVLSYRENERMAGKIAVWKPAIPQAKATPEIALNKVHTLFSADKPHLPDHALSYSAAPETENMNTDKGQTTPDRPFGFGDLLDMVNPLQHIPLIGNIYREVSGDEITPISRIIGGAVYGGPAGAGPALVNVVIEHDTGRDVAGNIAKLVTSPIHKNNPDTAAKKDELPAQLLRYTAPISNGKITEHSQAVSAPPGQSGWRSHALNG